MVKIMNGDTHILWKSLKISFKVKSKLSIFISILGLFISLLPAYIAITLKKFTDETRLLYGKGTDNMSTAFRLFALYAGLNIILIVFRAIQRYFLVVDSVKVQHYIKETIIRVCCKVKFKYLENYDEFNKKISFVESQAGQRVANSIQNIIFWIQDIITFISIIVLLYSINGWIIALLVIATLPSVYLAYKQKEEDFRTNTKYMKEGNWVGFRFKQICNRYAMKEIRYFRIFEFLKEQWSKTAKVYFEKKSHVVKKYCIFNSISDVLRNGVYIFVLLIIARLVFNTPEIGLGSFMLVFTLSSDFQNVTARLFIGITQFIDDRQYMQYFFSFENIELEDYDTDSTIFDKTEIKFSSVSFKYPNSEKYALHDINLTIKPGEKIAIVGENGSGKTTFVNLLCAMYEPEKGTITINDENVTNNISKTRRSISAMFQNFGRYETSIKHNISISDMNRECTDQILVDLTQKTGAYEFINQRSKRFDDIVGTINQSDEAGKNLSGGQWQKIAIARALFRNKANIMILDEPTAALDPISEAELYRQFSELTEDKTVMLISHRLGITSIVNRILVFHDGTIIEDGTHVELIKKDGLYAKMYKAQAQWYISVPKTDVV